jgi:hypothetical protein
MNKITVDLTNKNIEYTKKYNSEITEIKNKNKKVKELIKINCKLLNELDSSYLKENNLRMKLKIQRKIKLYCLMIIIKKKKINN